MPDWYKQSTKEHLNAKFRNHFPSDDEIFIKCNGMIHILKQVIGRNLDLKKAVVYRGQYLSTYIMDRDYFETIMKCKDWKKMNLIIEKLSELTLVGFYETDEGLIAIDIPEMLEDLDQYTARKLQKLINLGKISLKDIKIVNGKFNAIELSQKAIASELMSVSLDTNDNDTADKSCIVVDDTCSDLPQARVGQESISDNGFDVNSVNTLEDSKKHKVYSNNNGYLDETGTKWCRYKFPIGHAEHKNWEFETESGTTDKAKKKKNRNFLAG